MDCVELFAGGGGSAIGLAWAGLRHTYAVEKDSNACRTLRANGLQVDECLVSLWTRPVAPGSFLWASPPCQPYSRNGKQLGAKDARDAWPETLAQVYRIRPSIVVIENVAQAPGEQWRTELARLFPYTEVWNLKACDYQVSQRRARIFVVASFKPFTKPKPFPLMPLSSILPGDYWTREEQNGMRARHSSEVGHTLTTKGNVYLYSKDPGTRRPSDRVHHNNGRSLTTHEAALIMGFPDAWIWPCGSVETMKQIGNAVPPMLAYHVARALVC